MQYVVYTRICIYHDPDHSISINCRQSLKGPASSEAKYSTNMHLSNYYNIAELIDLTGISEAPLPSPPQKKISAVERLG